VEAEPQPRDAAGNLIPAPSGDPHPAAPERRFDTNLPYPDASPNSPPVKEPGATLTDENALPLDGTVPAVPAVPDDGLDWTEHLHKGHRVHIANLPNGGVRCRAGSYRGPDFDADSVDQALAQVQKLG